MPNRDAVEILDVIDVSIPLRRADGAIGGTG